MKLKEIATNSIWFGIIPKLTILVSLVITPLITPYLTQDDYGVWGVVSAYVGLITGFATLGLHIHLTNTYYEAKHHFRHYWRQLIFWMAAGSVVCFLVALIFLTVELPDTRPYNRYLVVVLASLPIIFNFNSVVATHYYNLKLQPKPLVIRNIIGSVAGSLTLFCSVYFFDAGYLGYVLSSLVSTILIFLLFIKPMWIDLKLYPQPVKLNKRSKDWFKIALPMMPHNVGHVLLASSSRIVMAAVAVPIASIGIYSNGAIFGEYASVVILAVITALTPVIQTTFRNNDHRQMRKIFLFTEAITLLITFGLSVWMREIYMVLVRNESLQISHTVASYTCFSLAMFPLYVMLSTVASIEKKTLHILWLIFVPAIISVVLNFIFVPIYGYRAAIFVTLTSYWLVSIIAIAVPYYRVKMKNWLGNPYLVLLLPVVCVSVLVLAQVLGNLPLSIKLTITVVTVVIGVLLIFKYKHKILGFNFVHKDIEV